MTPSSRRVSVIVPRVLTDDPCNCTRRTDDQSEITVLLYTVNTLHPSSPCTESWLTNLNTAGMRNPADSARPFSRPSPLRPSSIELIRHRSKPHLVADDLVCRVVTHSSFSKAWHPTSTAADTGYRDGDDTVTMKTVLYWNLHRTLAPFSKVIYCSQPLANQPTEVALLVFWTVRWFCMTQQRWSLVGYSCWWKYDNMNKMTRGGRRPSNLKSWKTLSSK